MKQLYVVSAAPTTILFLDNSAYRIYQTVEILRASFAGIYVFEHEKALWDFLPGKKVDVIFLHLDLAPNDALALLKEIRRSHAYDSTLVVIYSEKQDDFILELAFNAGADSFINFHAKAGIMKLFVRNLLRRRILRASQLARAVRLDSDRFLIFKEGIPVQLPRKEFRIFELLYNQCGRFISKKEIALEVWHDEGIAKRRTIDVHIYNIRQAFGRKIIQSKKGFGYRMNKKAAGL